MENLYSDEQEKLAQRRDAAARLNLVQAELKKEIDKYPSVTTGLKRLSEKMNLSERTIRRIVKGTHVPNYQTLIKIYRYLSGALNDRDTVKAMPPTIREAILRDCENFSIADPKKDFNPEIDFYIANDSIFRGIYLETGTGTIHRDRVNFLYGTEGIKVLDKMVKLDVVKEVESDIYASSKNRAQLDIRSIVELGKYLVESKLNPEKLDVNGENFCQLLFEGIDLETYNRLLTLEWETKSKRLDILKNASPGTVKYWSFTATDTLSSSYLYPDSSPENDQTKRGIQ